MSDSPEPQPDRRPIRQRLRWRWVWRTAGTLVVGFVATTMWLVAQREYRRSTGNSELAVAINEADSTDPDWTWERLNAARTTPPAGHNGADVIPRVRDLLPPEWVRDLKPEPWEPQFAPVAPNFRHTERTITTVRNTLTRAKPAVDAARGLKDCPTGRRDLPLKPDVMSTPMRDTPHTRTVARLLHWDAELAIEDGDAARLADVHRALLNTSRSIGDEPLLISQVIRVAARVIAVRSLERALAQIQLTDSQLAILQAAWAADAEEPILLYGVRGERAAYDVFLRNLADGTIRAGELSGLPKDDISFESYSWWLERGRFPGNRAYYLQWMTRAVEATRKPVHEQLPAVEALPLPRADDPSIRFAVLVLPAVPKVAGATTRSAAEARCAVVALACERFRLKHAHWPEALNELVPAFLPAVPLDPFTGAPLRNTKSNDGVVVFSTGKRAPPQPGAPAEERWLPDGIELGFRLWNPDQRRLPPLPDPPQPQPEHEPQP